MQLSGRSGPPRFRETTWSTTYPGHAPAELPVAGQECDFLNAVFAAGDREILAWASRLTPVRPSNRRARYLLESPHARHRHQTLQLLRDWHGHQHECSRSGWLPDAHYPECLRPAQTGWPNYSANAATITASTPLARRIEFLPIFVNEFNVTGKTAAPALYGLIRPAAYGLAA